MEPHQARGYRPDIDGLRAIAVMAVIAFHLDWLPNGYLGVDVFFVISGYLITSLCLREARAGRFTFLGFWIRRVRRILPLVCVVVAAALLVGSMVMLPDDLENLAQSVIATNLFANNILQVWTTRNYWDVVNEYKPLMHSWSLGIEEQYYLVFPVLIMFLLKGGRTCFVLTVGFLASVSLVLYLCESTEHLRFYLLHYRFFELAAGALLAMALDSGLPRLPVGWLGLISLMVLLTIDLSLTPTVRLMLVILSTMLIIVSDNSPARCHGRLLTNAALVFVGLISFSLYMWHHVVFAYARYTFLPTITLPWAIGLMAGCVTLSWWTWRFVERPFRDTTCIPTWAVLVCVAMGMLVTTASAVFIYSRGGVLRNVPELDIRVEGGVRYVHQAYNHRILDYNRAFPDTSRLNVLVVGNSFARDWANVLLESDQSSRFTLSYRVAWDGEAEARAKKADLIYVYSSDRSEAIDPVFTKRIWFIGSKSFGVSNGIFYNRPRDAQYCSQHASPDPTYLAADRRIRAFAGPRHIDILGRLRDPSGSVPVFTPECRFISMDTRHLTRAGAVFLAHLFADDITAHFARAGS